MSLPKLMRLNAHALPHIQSIFRTLKRYRMKRYSQAISFLITLVFATSVLRCAPEPSKSSYMRNGKEYGKVGGAFFRHRWWNHYERGLSFAEGEFYQEALADLKEAISQREKDQRMARTYGMHFIDYFPHRELGIVYYQIGNLEKAREELQLSLSQFPTSKARYYLDRVRKGLIERESREVPPPRLFIEVDTAEVWTREDPVILSGVAEDANYVASLSLMGVPLFMDGSKKSIRFEESLDLSQGRHVIDVEAKNLLGQTAKKEVIINVDRTGPLVAIDEVSIDRVSSAREITISGSIYDEAGVVNLVINGQEIPIQEGQEVPFVGRLLVEADSLEIAAVDSLGNQTSAEIGLPFGLSGEMRVLLALAETTVGADYELAGLFGVADTSPPRIKVKGWTESQTVFMDKAYIEGQVSDETQIEQLTINGVPILRRPGRYIFFSHMVDLKEGENNLTIEARDENGNRVSQIISIIRKVPVALQLAERLSITAFPFEQKGEITEAGMAFQDNLIDALVGQNRFQVIERDRLDLILQEQKLSRTKLFDRGTALRLGSLVAAKSIIMGSIIETRLGIEVVARLVDTETAEILATEDVYDEMKDFPSLKALAEGMAVKFHRDFPLVEGLVIGLQGDDIFTDLGADLVKLRRRLIVYREEPVAHPQTGKNLGSDNEIIARARVTQVMPEMSKAELIEAKGNDIRTLDKVITE